MTVDVVAYDIGHWDFFKCADPEINPETLIKASEFFQTEIYTMIKRPENIVLAIVGGKMIKEGVMELWLHVHKDLKKHTFSFYKGIKWMLKKMLESDLYRVQMTVDVDNEVDKRFAESLGFKQEGTLSGFHQGKDHYMYGKIERYQ